MVHGIFSKAKDIVSLGGYRIAASLAGVIFWFYFAKILEINEYGEFSYLLAIASVASSVSFLGLGTLVTVYEAKNEKVFSPAFTLGLISSSVVSIATFMLTESISVSLYILGMMAFGLMTSELLSQKKYSQYSLNILLQRILQILFSLLFYPIFGIEGIMIGYALSTIPALKALFRYVKEQKTNFHILKPKIGFMIYNYFIKLTAHLFWWGDKLLIQSLFDYMTLGTYQIASQFIQFALIIPATFSLYFLPQESQGLKNTKLKKYSILFSGIVTILSFVILPYFMNYFLPKYNESVFAMQIMVLALIPINYSGILNVEFVGRGVAKIPLSSALLLLISYYFLVWLLGDYFGLSGIALSFFISNVVRLIYLLSVKKILKII